MPRRFVLFFYFFILFILFAQISEAEETQEYTGWDLTDSSKYFKVDDNNPKIIELKKKIKEAQAKGVDSEANSTTVIHYNLLLEELKEQEKNKSTHIDDPKK